MTKTVSEQSLVGIQLSVGFLLGLRRNCVRELCRRLLRRFYYLSILFSVQRRDKSDALDSHRSARTHHQSLHSQRRLANCRSNARFLTISSRSQAHTVPGRAHIYTTMGLPPALMQRLTHIHAFANPSDCTLRRVSCVQYQPPGSF